MSYQLSDCRMLSGDTYITRAVVGVSGQSVWSSVNPVGLCMNVLQIHNRQKSDMDSRVLLVVREVRRRRRLTRQILMDLIGLLHVNIRLYTPIQHTNRHVTYITIGIPTDGHTHSKKWPDIAHIWRYITPGGHTSPHAVIHHLHKTVHHTQVAVRYPSWRCITLGGRTVYPGGHTDLSLITPTWPNITTDYPRTAPNIAVHHPGTRTSPPDGHLHVHYIHYIRTDTVCVGFWSWSWPSSMGLPSSWTAPRLPPDKKFGNLQPVAQTLHPASFHRLCRAGDG